MKRIFASFALASMIFVQAFAQEEAAQESARQKNDGKETVALTVEQALDLAKERNRTLKSAQIDLEIKERASKYSWNVFLPAVNGSFTVARSTEVDLTQANNMIQMANAINALSSAVSGKPFTLQPSLTDKEKNHWAMMGNVTASLNLSLAYIGQIRAAKADYEVGKITWEKSQKETLMNIKKLFYGLLIQQEGLAVQKATLENARQRAVQAEANYRNGLIPELRLLNAQVTYENQRPQVESAEQSVNQQMDTFAFLLGLPVGTNIKLVGSIEPEYVNVTSEELLEKYSDNSLDIRSTQGNIEMLKCNLMALDLSSYTPALALNYAYKPTKAFASEDDKWPDQGSFSITLAWNITNMLPFSANRQKAKDLQATLKKLELAMETLRENQKVQVKKAVDTLNQAREQIDSMGRNITLAQRAYESSARSYRNGTTELLDLRDTESQLNQAKLGQLNQKFNYISALMDLEYTLNTDLSSYKE